ncbi:MAG TPA: TadE/TadG family type IV pilus assembly protein [Candidatus Dormibacteraeota bacterium]|nr:TadE/TadG family type IV pilus assembly protein [Candidatus Dormibacteraeota bacterium]
MNRKCSERGAAILEFALAWPVALLLALGCVELAIWGAESYAASSAALAGARAGSVTGSSPRIAALVTMRALSPNLVGVQAGAWCPGQAGAAPPVWVCAADLGSAVQVEVGGAVPALVPVGLGRGLPLHAHVEIQKEAFTR